MLLIMYLLLLVATTKSKITVHDFLLFFLNFTAYYSIELYIKFKKIDSFTNIISRICLRCIRWGYYNFMY